jgi:predicted nucleotidyltransferase
MARACGDLSVPFFVAGAMARDILLNNVFGIETTRATQDIDLAIAVRNWDQFQALKDRLTATGEFDIVARRIERLYYKASRDRPGYPVDLIPFRGVERQDQTIAWPPEMAVVMNVAAYEEALSSAISVTIAQDLSLPIASLPGLALLKLFAWADRHNETPKDAQDLAILCRTYESAGNQDRLYGDKIDILEAVSHEFELASARLLGHDARATANASTLERATALLNNAKDLDRLTTQMAIEFRAADDSIAAAAKLLEQFKTGLLEN